MITGGAMTRKSMWDMPPLTTKLVAHRNTRKIREIVPGNMTANPKIRHKIFGCVRITRRHVTVICVSELLKKPQA